MKRNTGGWGGKNRSWRERKVDQREGRREERRKKKDESERVRGNLPPLVILPPTFQRSNFLFLIICEYSNTEGSTSVYRECEWADKSWNILLLLRKSWLLPALPGNISGNRCQRLTWVFLLEEQPSGNVIIANHKGKLLHIANTSTLAPLDFWRYVQIKIMKLGWERFYGLKPNIYCPATP